MTGADARGRARRCKLARVPAVVERLSGLRILDLTNNRLTNAGLPAGLARLPHLKAIGLKKNCLTAVPRVLGALRSLQEIYLEDNTELEVRRPRPRPRRRPRPRPRRRPRPRPRPRIMTIKMEGANGGCLDVCPASCSAVLRGACMRAPCRRSHERGLLQRGFGGRAGERGFLG